MSGLIAWTRREEWRDALAERIERHAAKACAGAGVEVAAIEALLGEYGVSTVWGAAFEDLLAGELPGGRNIADDYLRRRGWNGCRGLLTSLRHINTPTAAFEHVSEMSVGRCTLKCLPRERVPWR